MFYVDIVCLGAKLINIHACPSLTHLVTQIVMDSVRYAGFIYFDPKFKNIALYRIVFGTSLLFQIFTSNIVFL